jgi:hypothetical protein
MIANYHNVCILATKRFIDYFKQRKAQRERGFIAQRPSGLPGYVFAH